MKRTAIAIMLFFMAFSQAFSEEAPATEADTKPAIKWDASVSLQNQHYWRGMQTGEGLSFEAGLTLQLSENLTAGLWNGTAINGTYKEIDFYVTYAKNGFSVSVLDYYCPREAVFSSEFSDWNEPSTPHLIDLQLGYTLSNTPFSIMLSTMVWGDDLDDANKNQYSTYLELGYHQAIEEMNTSFILGYSPWGSMYHSEPGLVNLETQADCKLVSRDEFSLNLNTKIIYNPILDDIYFGAGLSIRRN